MIGALALIIAAQTELLPAEIRGDWRIVERREEKPYRTGSEDEEIFDPITRELYVYAATTARSREEAELERTRAIITSAFYAFDTTKDWSNRRAWKACNSWRSFLHTVMSPLEHTANEDPRGFADPRGRRSPRWDLATFAARYFTGDTKTKCRLLAQSRFLTDRLLELGADAAHPSCAAFDRWTRTEHIEHLEIDLATPTSQTIGSLFGHLFMRIADDKNRVIAFLAESRGVLEDDPLYPLKGIFGGYTAMLHEKSFLDTYRDYVITESRHIRRWKLRLTPEQQTRVLEVIWTRLHTARYSYYFFAQNCATLLLELFASLIPNDRALVAEGSLGRGPASVLDALSSANLLEYIAEPFSSYKGEAVRAERERAPISRKLAALSPELADSIDVIENAADPRQRAPAYDRVAPALEQLDDADAQTWLRSSAALEAHASAEANLEEETELGKKRRVETKKLVAAYREYLPLELGPIVEPILELLEHDDEATRFAGYRAAAVLLEELPEHKASALRLYVLARADLSFDAIRRADPALHAKLFVPDPSRPVIEQNFVKGFEAMIEKKLVTRVSPALLAVQRAKQRVFATRTLAHGDPDRAARAAKERARYEGSYGHTGVDALSFAGGVDSAGTVGLTLRGAAYEETLGEQRRHGFPATTAFSFLRTETFWTRGDRLLPIVKRSETRFLGYRSVGEARRFGFELYGDLNTRRDVHTDLSPSAGAGALWSLLSSDDFADHVIASGGLAYEAILPSNNSGDVHAVVAPLRLEMRKGLGGPLHALRGSFTARPRFDLFAQKMELELRGEGELRVLLVEGAELGFAHDVGVSLVARGRWERAHEDELYFDAGVLFD